MPPDGEGECHKARRINTPPPPMVCQSPVGNHFSRFT